MSTKHDVDNKMGITLKSSPINECLTVPNRSNFYPIINFILKFDRRYIYLLERNPIYSKELNNFTNNFSTVKIIAMDKQNFINELVSNGIYSREINSKEDVKKMCLKTLSSDEILELWMKSE